MLILMAVLISKIELPLSSHMNLNFAVNFEELNSRQGLRKLDVIFLDYLKTSNQNLYHKLLGYRALSSQKNNPQGPEFSNFLIDLAAYLDDFISRLFFIEQENLRLKRSQRNFDIIYECRRKFVQRVCKTFNENVAAEESDFAQTSHALTKILGTLTEKKIAEYIMHWLTDPEKFRAEIELATAYAQHMVLSGSTLPLFDIPRPRNQDNLVRDHKIRMLSRDIQLGFDYRDHEINLKNGLTHAKYCIYCHNQQKDTCRSGLEDLRQPPTEKNEGCPLDQKISEMNKLMAAGFNIGALGVIVIDNPLVAATGHRICNDCMKSCIFQKQDPVNVPLVESTILDNVLNLPYGVEIYILLTRWNPLSIASPLPAPSTGYNVLVAGLGPAGFALAHYLLNEGHNVTAIDGLKIQPLNFDPGAPVKNYQKIKTPLSKRIPHGFGGVAEYGITNRWDKNNLTLVRLILQRRTNNFKMMGGIRLGSNITTSQAFGMGFDHIALCLGAGKPRYINSPSYFYKGVKSAADFLMNLQQGGSYLNKTNSRLLLRMPVVVIGCGLTAIDSAVEAIHYYQMQVENFLTSCEQDPEILVGLSEEDRIIASEFNNHARGFREARSMHEKLELIEQTGGVTICYRNIIRESPAYKRNHEEIEHARAIGVKFAENLSPAEIRADKYDYAEQVCFSDLDGGAVAMPAKTVLIAIGTEENEFLDIEEFTRNDQDGRFSHFGDCNQKYSGSVVKALASAKNGYKNISRQLKRHTPATRQDFAKLSKILDEQLAAEVYSVKKIFSSISELVIKSPLAAQNYQPGQIFRLQNFADRASAAMKPLALSPYEVDPEAGLISFIISKTGSSTSLATNLGVGEEVVLMGPGGTGTKIPLSATVILIGHGIRNMALLPIMQKIKERGAEIIFFAGYKRSKDIFYAAKIEKLADKIFWVAEDKPPAAQRAQDMSIRGTLTDAITLAIDQKLLPARNLNIICYTDHQIIQNIKKLELFSSSSITCNLLSPMQCMMKGICGQCVQKTEDEKGYIFACACQEYDIKNFDSEILSNRLQQNSLLEKTAKR